jgi:hypothetical protein
VHSKMGVRCESAPCVKLGTGQHHPLLTQAHAAVLRYVLERRGVEFTNCDGPGVKLKAREGRR